MMCVQMCLWPWRLGSSRLGVVKSYNEEITGVRSAKHMSLSEIGIPRRLGTCWLKAADGYSFYTLRTAACALPQTKTCEHPATTSRDTVIEPFALVTTSYL